MLHAFWRPARSSLTTVNPPGSRYWGIVAGAIGGRSGTRSAVIAHPQHQATCRRRRGTGRCGASAAGAYVLGARPGAGHSGMYGMYALRESVRQMRGSAPAQIPGAKISVCHGVRHVRRLRHNHHLKRAVLSSRLRGVWRCTRASNRFGAISHPSLGRYSSTLHPGPHEASREAWKASTVYFSSCSLLGRLVPTK